MDEDLREQLEKHHQDAYVWAMRCSNQNMDLAKESMQMVYLKILEGKAQFKGYSKFSTWLFTIIKNTVTDLYRSQEARFVKQQKYIQNFDEKVEDNTRDERMIELKKRILELSERQQQVLELKCYHDLTLEDIAEIMEISIGSVRQHYDRAKKKMKEILTSSQLRNERRR